MPISKPREIHGVSFTVAHLRVRASFAPSYLRASRCSCLSFASSHSRALRVAVCLLRLTFARFADGRVRLLRALAGGRAVVTFAWVRLSFASRFCGISCASFCVVAFARFADGFTCYLYRSHFVGRLHIYQPLWWRHKECVQSGVGGAAVYVGTVSPNLYAELRIPLRIQDSMKLRILRFRIP